MILTASGLISGHPTSPDVRLRAQKAVSTTPAPGQHDGEGARLHRSTQPSSCIFIKYIYIYVKTLPLELKAITMSSAYIYGRISV